MKDINLKTPDFSDHRILGYNVGVRPYRKSGIRLDVERSRNKTIIHNYGYGGSGLTLCWGGAQEVLHLLNQEAISPATNKIIAILGAGVIGLATAYELLTQGYQVNIYAQDFSPHLTSNVAAGILSSPAYGEESEEHQVRLHRMLDVSMQRYKANLVSKEPEFAGVKFLTDYRFEKKASDTLSQKFKGLAAEQNNVRVQFDNGMTKLGTQNREMGLDGKLFMDDIYAQVKVKGAKIYQKDFQSKNDFDNLSEEILINCTSLGSRELFNDQDFIPIRGHLVYFKLQEGIDYSMYQAIPHESDYWVKLYPWSDRLILGGVFEHGKDNSVCDQNVINALIRHARNCFNQ